MKARSKTTALLGALLLATAVPAEALAAQTTPAATATTRAKPHASPRASLRLDVGGRRAGPWVGEAVPVTVTAVFRGVEQVTLEGPVRLQAGAVITQDLGAKPMQSQETLGGQPALVVRWSGTITPSTAGPLGLKAELPVRVRYRTEAPVATRERTRQDPFDAFDDPFGGDDAFGDPFASSMFRAMRERMHEMSDLGEARGAVREEELALSADARDVSARALPTTGRPATFTGAVGHFDVRTSLPSSALRVSEPVTLRMTVEGEGDLDRVDLQGIESNADFKAYPAHAVAPPAGSAPSGRPSKIFEQTIVPLRAGDVHVPGVALTAFDPARGSYVRDESAPLAVTVAATAAATPAPPATTTAIAPAPATAPTDATAATGAPAAAAHVSSHVALFVAGAVAWALLAGAAFVAFARAKRGGPTPGALRRRMRRAASAGAPGSFLAFARDLIRSQLARRWGLPAEAVTGQLIRDRLGDAGEPLARALALDAASRFGGAAEPTDLRAMCTDIERTLEAA